LLAFPDRFERRHENDEVALQDGRSGVSVKQAS